MITALDELLRLYADYDALECAKSLMNWDRQVHMPEKGGFARTVHVGILARKAHEVITSDEFARALEAVTQTSDPGSEAASMARVLQRLVDTESKLPTRLVDRKSRISSEAYDQWKISKATNDFKALAPYYEQLFEIARETAELIGYSDHIYDPLIDLFEEGATFAEAEAMFATIKRPISDLVRQIQEDGRPVEDGMLYGNWDADTLVRFAERTVSKIGFQMNRGKLNLAPNAFCMNLSCDDVRMTTRASDHLKGVISSSLHEMGHGIYEQNSPAMWDRTPLAGGASLAIHESQSRLWENIVGRSRGFWQHFFPDLQSTLPRLDSMDAEGFYRAFNKVEPDFIRVGADELTYNLHILVRFELEVDILTEKLSVRDLPDAWNTKYEEYLGITPPTNSLGCLQDVHWSRGSIGYFPTYAMGNLIGGQIWKCLRTEIDDTDGLMADGRFEPILDWLRAKIYSKAKSVKPRELVVEVTGKPMGASDWLDYAQKKYVDLYGLA